jgi:hypothetical protein
MRNHPVLVLCALVVVGGCSTAAQREFKATSEAGQTAVATYKECNAAVDQNAAYADLTSHLAITSPATLTQLADASSPTDEQAAALDSWHTSKQSCRQGLLDAAQASFDFMVPAYQQNYASVDSIYLSLAKKDISFGEASRQLAQAKLEADARIRAAANGWKSELEAENRQEKEERAAAFRALGAGLQQAGAAMQQQAQQQQLINAINRPVTTTCSQTGIYTNCTSQ